MPTNDDKVSPLFLLPFLLFGVAILVLGVPTGFLIGGAVTMHGLGAFDPPYAVFFNERSSEYKAEKEQRRAEAETEPEKEVTGKEIKKQTVKLCKCLEKCFKKEDDDVCSEDCYDKYPDGDNMTAVSHALGHDYSCGSISYLYEWK